jgi:hypothetical protein
MNALQKKFLFVAAAGVATWVFIQSPSAQTIGTDHAAAAQSAASYTSPSSAADALARSRDGKSVSLNG